MTDEVVFKGDLGVDTLPEIFGLLYHYQVSATVEYRSDNFESRVYIREGAVISAESTHYEEQLERTVLMLRKVAPNKVREFFSSSSGTWVEQGDGLIEKGLVAPEEIDYLFNYLAKSIVYSIMKLDGGGVTVTIGPYDEANLIRVRQPLADLVMDGSRCFLLDEKLKGILRGGSTIYRMTHTAKGKLRGFYLSPGERMVLRLVDGKRSLKDLCTFSPYTDYDTCRLLAGLLLLKVLEIV